MKRPYPAWFIRLRLVLYAIPHILSNQYVCDNVCCFTLFVLLVCSLGIAVSDPIPGNISWRLRFFLTIPHSLRYRPRLGLHPMWLLHIMFPTVFPCACPYWPIIKPALVFPCLGSFLTMIVLLNRVIGQAVTEQAKSHTLPSPNFANAICVSIVPSLTLLWFWTCTTSTLRGLSGIACSCSYDNQLLA
jgi:hypothetical protein